LQLIFRKRLRCVSLELHFRIELSHCHAFAFHVLTEHLRGREFARDRYSARAHISIGIGILATSLLSSRDQEQILFPDMRM